MCGETLKSQTMDVLLTIFVLPACVDTKQMLILRVLVQNDWGCFQNGRQFLSTQIQTIDMSNVRNNVISLGPRPGALCFRCPAMRPLSDLF